MTKDMMRVVLCDENIKEIMMKRLAAAEIKIKAEEFDIIAAELPNNDANIVIRSPIEKTIPIWISKLPVEGQMRELLERPYGEKTPTELCESMKQILRERGNENVFSRIHKIDRGKFPSSVHKYHLLIAIGLKKSIAGYAELFEYITDNVNDKLKSCGDFVEMSKTESGRQVLFEDMQKKWILFGKFAEYYMKEKGLPEPGVLTQLSAARYEGSESEARIYFTKDGIDTVEKFIEDSEGDRVIEKNNQRMIRKLMEISKRNKVYLYADNGINKKSGKTKHTVSELVQRKETQDKDTETDIDKNTYVKFSGFMHWSLFIEGREIFAYYHGEYQFNIFEERYAYLNRIKQLKGIDREMIEKLVDILREQKHGAVAVIFDEKTDASDEADRLCMMKRGTRICGDIRYDEGEGWNKEQILSVSGIDGALFIDHSGKCLAIGVIVDGKAVKKGNVGRGARYNSIANYMKLKPGCVGIVVSEDGMIDVIQERPALQTKAAEAVQNV